MCLGLCQELRALGDAMGVVSRGAPPELIQALPLARYVAPEAEVGRATPGLVTCCQVLHSFGFTTECLPKRFPRCPLPATLPRLHASDEVAESSKEHADPVSALWCSPLPRRTSRLPHPAAAAVKKKIT